MIDELDNAFTSQVEVDHEEGYQYAIVGDRSTA